MQQRVVPIVILLLLCISALAQAQEVITLTTPETVPNNTVYAIASVLLDAENVRIAIALKGANGERASCLYQGTLAQTLLTALNKADLSSAFNNNATTGSLKQRIHYRLSSTGLNEAPQVCGRSFVGTLTGSVP